MVEISIVANGMELGQLQTQAPGKLWHLLDRDAQVLAVIHRQNPWIKILDQTLLRIPGAETLLDVTRLMKLSEFMLRLPLARDMVPPVYMIQDGKRALLVARYCWGAWQLKPQIEIAPETLALIQAGLAQIARLS